MLSESVHAEKKKELSAGKSVESEVVSTAKRRRFTIEYKLSILEQADQCSKPGQLGLLLRREGLYSNSLYTWRKWRDKLNHKKNASQSSIK